MRRHHARLHDGARRQRRQGSDGEGSGTRESAPAADHSAEAGNSASPAAKALMWPVVRNAVAQDRPRRVRIGAHREDYEYLRDYDSWRVKNETKSCVSARPTGTSRQTTRSTSRGSPCRTVSATRMSVASTNNTREIPRWNRRSSDSTHESRCLLSRRPSSESVQLFLSEQALHASAGAR